LSSGVFFSTGFKKQVGVSTTVNDNELYDHVIEFHTELPFSRFVTPLIQSPVNHRQHGKNQGHVQDDFYPVFVHRHEMAEIQFLLEETEKHFHIPSFFIVQSDPFSFKVKDIRQEPKGFSRIIFGYYQPEMFSGNCFFPFLYN
jgi:hypothetical protein